MDYPPHIVSAGHDGFCPYDIYPFDEIYVMASRYSKYPEEHSVEIWLPYGTYISISNSFEKFDKVKVHRSGCLWHDRTRDVFSSPDRRWLSAYGFTSEHPKNLRLDDRNPLFAVLPNSQMKEDILDLLGSEEWRQAKDFHARHRDWMKKPKKSIYIQSLKYERDTVLVAQLKQQRGTACQICGFTFAKKDGNDYCEIHHLESLANGGFDIASNMLVLCANCHRKFHYGNVRVISHTAFELAVTIDGKKYFCRVG